ncbi:hypothetical protein O0L34_g11818 [Tuta absoluta]|nr:hypothetical protein O0L34_g11818 [Tuta absoluta]
MNIILLIHNIQKDSSVEEEQKNKPILNVTEINIEDVYEMILNKTRDRIKWELRRYNWSKSGFNQLEDLVPEKDGRPLKTIIISPWRSGAGYLGYLFGSLPGVLYFFRPLFHLEDRLNVNLVIRRNQTLSAQGLKSVLNCEVLNATYVDSLANLTILTFYHDSRMWRYCKLGYEACMDLEFRKRFCELFPFLVVKDEHVRLQNVEELVADQDSSIKVIVLIRDPRAVIRSRVTDQCKPGTSCVNIEKACEEMVADHSAARKLLLKYPRKIKILRFEELVQYPGNTVRDLLRFSNLHMLRSAEEFLLSQRSLGNRSDTWLPEGEAFDWKGDMNYQMVEDIQETDACKEAMELWGYRLANSWSHQTSQGFIPITNYEIKERNETLTDREVKLL